MTSSVTKTHMNERSHPASSFTNNFKDISGCRAQVKHSGPGQPPSSRAVPHQTSHVSRLTHDVSKEYPQLHTQTEALPVMDHLCSDGYKAHVMFSREPSSISRKIPRGFVGVLCCCRKPPGENRYIPLKALHQYHLSLR